MRKNSAFKRIVALAMGFGLIGGHTAPAFAADSNAVQTQSKKDAINQRISMPRPVSARRINGASDANPYKYCVTPKGNQRQKRKFLRQNPHLRSKYK